MASVRQMSLSKIMSRLCHQGQIIITQCCIIGRNQNMPCPASPTKKRPRSALPAFPEQKKTYMREKGLFLEPPPLLANILDPRFRENKTVPVTRRKNVSCIRVYAYSGGGSVFPPLSMLFLIKSSSWCLPKIIQMSVKRRISVNRSLSSALRPFRHSLVLCTGIWCFTKWLGTWIVFPLNVTVVFSYFFFMCVSCRRALSDPELEVWSKNFPSPALPRPARASRKQNTLKFSFRTPLRNNLLLS